MSYSRSSAVPGPSSAPVLLFLHIPKTAGLTFTQLIYANCWDAPAGARLNGRPAAEESVYWYLGDAAEGFKGFSLEDALAPPSAEARAALARPRLRAVVGHFVFGLHREISRRSTYVTFLRDPVGRAVSRYAHQVLWRNDRYGVVSEDLTFAEYVAQRRDRDLDNGQVRRLVGADVPFGACSPEMLARAKENLRRHFSFVGVTERFDESVVALADALGWRELFYAPDLVNPHRPDLGARSEEALAEIAALNGLDAELHRFVATVLDERLDALGDGIAPKLAELRREQEELADTAWKPIDLNRASLEQLAELPGVGPALAEAIVAHRHDIGAYRGVQELLDVRGIGMRRYYDLALLVST